MRKIINDIVNDDEINSRPSIDDVINYFSHEKPSSTTWNYNNGYCKTTIDKLELEPIHPNEVLSVLKSTDNTSPSGDKITYRDLSLLDPEDNWRKFQTTLIPKPDKDGQYKNINYWRPIALLSTSYKIFSSILTRRLEHWIRYNNLLNRCQKGGSKYEGCIEHNAILNVAFQHSKYTRHLSISVAWLEIANAFPNVPHKYLWGLLHFIGVDDSFFNILELFYTEISSFYACGPITTPDLPIQRGVKQSCHISMTLLALAINPVLEVIEILSVPKFSIGINSVKVLADADDIALIANNTPDLQKLIDKAVEITEWACLIW